MAALVDESYYRNVYKGAEVYDDLPTLLDRASDIVRQHTLYRLEDVDGLPFFMQENVKKAVCSQAEFIDQNGGLDGFCSGTAASFSIGKFSMSGLGGGRLRPAGSDGTEKSYSSHSLRPPAQMS